MHSIVSMHMQASTRTVWVQNCDQRPDIRAKAVISETKQTKPKPEQVNALLLLPAQSGQAKPHTPKPQPFLKPCTPKPPRKPCNQRLACQAHAWPTLFSEASLPRDGQPRLAAAQAGAVRCCMRAGRQPPLDSSPAGLQPIKLMCQLTKGRRGRRPH